MGKGWTLLLPSGPRGNHLFFVLNDVQGDGRAQLILAPLCSVKRMPDGKVTEEVDETCVLNVGDHQFVKHESYVSYAQCRSYRLDHIERMYKARTAIRHEDASPDLIERIVRGALASDKTEPEYKNLLLGKPEDAHLWWR